MIWVQETILLTGRGVCVDHVVVWPGPSSSTRFHSLVEGATMSWEMALDCLSGTDMFSIFLKPVMSLKSIT